jgi:hypothetical protein
MLPRVLPLVTLIAVMSTVGAVDAVASVVSDGASVPPFALAAKQRRCGLVRVDGMRFRVTIDRGHVRCRTARRVVRRFFRGDGERHGGPSSAETYWTIGEWRCGSGAGGVGCIRQGKTWDRARDRIVGESS